MFPTEHVDSIVALFYHHHQYPSCNILAADQWNLSTESGTCGTSAFFRNAIKTIKGVLCIYLTER
jgi:hypothetical protein